MTDEPTIAERVRFWQEQDRINNSLIPRVVKLHERLLKLETQDLSVSPLIAALESRIAMEQKAAVADLRGEITDVANGIDRRLAQLRTEIAGEFRERLEHWRFEIVKDFETRFSRLHRTFILLGVSTLVTAVVSLAISLLR
jgi:hypothetical protein